MDNEFTDFDEPRAETAIGWRGFTIAPQFGKSNFDLSGEFTMIDYNTNWQAWGDDHRPITSTDYASMELDTGVGHNWRSAYAPFQDKSTKIAVLNAKYTIESGKGIDLMGKVKYIKETDNRLNDPKYLPYQPGRLPRRRRRLHQLAELLLRHEHDVRLLLEPVGHHGRGRKRRLSVEAVRQRRRRRPRPQVPDLSLGCGYQLTDDLYGTVTAEYYHADLRTGIRPSRRTTSTRWPRARTRR